MDKTEGEARGKVKSVQAQGGGIEAYRTLHVWFTKISNLELQERRAKVMMPEKAPNEAAIVVSIEKWERAVRELKEATKEAPLSDAMMRTALQKIITGPLETSVKKRDSKLIKS